MLEYEMKLPLTREEYTLLSEQEDRHAEVRIQTNYYYDSDNFDMNRAGITCRIRKRDGIYTATVKEHGYGEHCSKETSARVTDEKDTSLFEGKDIKLQGNMITHRTVLYSTEEYEAVLDKNTYLGTTDYELEVEYTEKTEENALRFIERAKETLAMLSGEITLESNEQRKRPKSKSERFFERLTDLRCREDSKAEDNAKKGKEVTDGHAAERRGSQYTEEKDTPSETAELKRAEHQTDDDKDDGSDDIPYAYSTAYAMGCAMDECERCGRNHACDTWLSDNQIR